MHHSGTPVADVVAANPQSQRRLSSFALEIVMVVFDGKILFAIVLMT